MNFTEYQKKARETAVYPGLGSNLWYPALGLGGETGEVEEKTKKIYRDKGGQLDEKSIVDLCLELGDVLWYVANYATELGVDLGLIAEMNIEKLASRAARDKVHGSGDNR